MSSIHISRLATQATENKLDNDPPTSGKSIPSRSYGFGNERYWAFVEALFDGLLEYDTTNGGTDLAPTLPVA